MGRIFFFFLKMALKRRRTGMGRGVWGGVIWSGGKAVGRKGREEVRLGKNRWEGGRGDILILFFKKVLVFTKYNCHTFCIKKIL